MQTPAFIQDEAAIQRPPHVLRIVSIAPGIGHELCRHKTFSLIDRAGEHCVSSAVNIFTRSNRCAQHAKSPTLSTMASSPRTTTLESAANRIVKRRWMGIRTPTVVDGFAVVEYTGPKDLADRGAGRCLWNWDFLDFLHGGRLCVYVLAEGHPGAY